MSLDDLLTQLRARTWVDLTHAFEPGIPHYSGFPDERREQIVGYEDGFLAHEYRHVGQWGTHMDPPLHFVPGGRAQDEVAVREMILPLAVIDARPHVAGHRGFAAGAALVEADEAENGPIPDGAFVALNTGWGALWPDGEAMRDGPGWDVSALRLLVEQRGVVAIGHDTTDTDPGALVDAGQTPAETYILNADRWQIELMANLDAVPPRGALIVATWPKPRAGSGFPARCFAII